MSQQNKPVAVTLETFEKEVTQSAIPVVVDFWAPWCAPCRAISPMLEEMAATWAGKVKVAKVNVDEEPGLAEVFRITGIPTLLAIRGSKVVGTQVGLAGRGALEQLFADLARAPAPQAAASA